METIPLYSHSEQLLAFYLTDYQANLTLFLDDRVEGGNGTRLVYPFPGPSSGGLDQPAFPASLEPGAQIMDPALW